MSWSFAITVEPSRSRQNKFKRANDLMSARSLRMSRWWRGFNIRLLPKNFCLMRSWEAIFISWTFANLTARTRSLRSVLCGFSSSSFEYSSLSDSLRIVALIACLDFSWLYSGESRRKRVASCSSIRSPAVQNMTDGNPRKRMVWF